MSRIRLKLKTKLKNKVALTVLPFTLMTDKAQVINQKRRYEGKVKIG
jgi:hypothetical protein